MKNISSETILEKERHDRLYKRLQNKDLHIEDIHHQKFDKIKKHIHPYTYAVKSLGDIRGERTLDLACGTGWFSVILAKRGALVDGIDISPVAIRIAKKRAVANEVSDVTTFSTMSFLDLDFPDEYFDKIIGLSALHHTHHKKLLSDLLYRVLKPKGIIIFDEPFGNSRTFERLRLLVPVKVNEADKTHWNEQIKYKDLEVFKSNFKVSYKEFQFISRMDKIIKSRQVVQLMGKIDLNLLEHLPSLRAYARHIVIILYKPCRSYPSER